MSDPPLGRYHFLSWARRGVGASVSNPDNNGSLPGRASLSVQLSLDVQKGGTTTTVQPTPMQVQMFGPGDVIGIDPRHIIRTEPRNFTVNYEPNYLAGIEFDTPDLPWLYTPAAPAGDRLRPWITLIVLALPEYLTVPGVGTPLPAIDVKTMAALQPLDDAWNWAHTQVSGDAGLAASDSASVISR